MTRTEIRAEAEERKYAMVQDHGLIAAILYRIFRPLIASVIFDDSPCTKVVCHFGDMNGGIAPIGSPRGYVAD
jgi:hypothetical protein